jgi:hypothetical protein
MRIKTNLLTVLQGTCPCCLVNRYLKYKCSRYVMADHYDIGKMCPGSGRTPVEGSIREEKWSIFLDYEINTL